MAATALLRAGLWQVGPFRFDTAARTLTPPGGEAERISGKAAQVLLQLAVQAGQVVSREDLIARVWQGNAYTGETALTHTVSLLRRSLRRAAPAEGAADPIETISKSGYRLLWPAQPCPGQSTAPAAPDTEPGETLPDTGAPSTQPMPLADTPTTPAAPTRTKRFGGPVMLLLFALLAWAALTLLRRGEASAPAAAPGTTRAPTPLTTLEGVEDWPSYSADGRLLAYVWRRNGSPPRLRVADAGTRGTPAAPRELSDPRDLIVRPVWVGSDRLAYLQGEHLGDCRVMLRGVDAAAAPARDLGACLFIRGAPALAASPDGEWLAFARRSAQAHGGMVLWLHHLPDGQERALAETPAGTAFGHLSWTHDGRYLAATRLKDTIGELLRLDVRTGATLTLADPGSPIWGMAWREGDRELVFSTGLQGDFALWRVPAEGGSPPSRFARVETVTSLTAIPDGTGDMAASVRRYDDHIERHALGDAATGPQLLESIRSSGRDMSADACADAAHPLFVSFRSRRIGLWYRDGADAEPRPLPLPEGTPEPPACSPDGQRFATALPPAPGQPGNRLVVGPLDGSPPQVFDLPAMLSNVSWSEDGRSLLLTAADRAGSASLWRFDLAARSTALAADDHARFGREVSTEGRHWLYYSRDGERGLWRRPLDATGHATGTAQRVVDDLAPQDWGNWTWRDGQLWRITRSPQADRLLRRDATGQDQVMLTLPAGSVSPFRALSVDRQGQVLLTRQGLPQADLMRVPEAP